MPRLRSVKALLCKLQTRTCCLVTLTALFPPPIVCSIWRWRWIQFRRQKGDNCSSWLLQQLTAPAELANRCAWRNSCE